MFRRLQCPSLRVTLSLALLVGAIACGEGSDRGSTAAKARPSGSEIEAESIATAEMDAMATGRADFGRERPIDLGGKRNRRPVKAFTPIPFGSEAADDAVESP